MNVLFIMTDQQRADHLSCAGNPILKTPNIDSIAKDGIRFTNAFCANPMCMPNRASMVTGLYPMVHGVRSNGINLSTEVPTLAKILKKRGYHTAAVGKMHYQFWTPPYKMKTKSTECIGDWFAEKVENNPVRENFPIPYYGFEDVEMVLAHGTMCSGHYFDWLKERNPKYIPHLKKKYLKFLDNFFTLFCDLDLSEEYYNTTYVKERSIAFLERYAHGDYENKPFYLHCSFPDPHHPVCPPGKYKDMYNPDKINFPSSFDDIENLRNHPFLGPLLEEPVIKGAMLRESTEEEVRKFMTLTYGSLTMVDDAVGEILTTLEKLGLIDNTMVMYTSDHGDLMGEHGMLLKGPCPYNCLLNVPLLWKVPGLTKPSVSDSLVSSIDFTPTILNILNIKERHQPPDMQGLDITSILEDPNKKVRDCFLIEEDEEVGPYGPLYTRVRHLITDTHKLTVYAELPGFGDLFDRKNDPDEINNLWYDEKELQCKMLDKILHESLMRQSRYPKRVSAT